jgi:hypothetical protein
MEGLAEIITRQLQQPMVNDDDKLLMSVLGQLKGRIDEKLLKHQTEYVVKMPHHQAIALRILYTYYIGEHSSYMGSKLHYIANEIHQHYS